MKKLSFALLFSLNTFVIFSQNKEQDSLQMHALKEVVLTGQIEPQSLKKSVHNVRIISSEDIANLGATHLGDILNQYINITVRPSSNSGKSTVAMFGLDAGYFKILIDNVPLVNESGFGNNIDLSQINLNDIEQIEIIEGSMGVTHGANAVTGILNIITKKTSNKKWNITTSLQEETVGKEFSLFEKGRHIQNVKLSHKFKENWFVSIGSNRNDFKGFLGNNNGKTYTINDGTRGYSWLPKEQWQNNVLLSYKNDLFRMFYKFEKLDEEVDYYSATVQSGYNTMYGAYKYGDDQKYFTSRLYNHLNAVGKMFSKWNYNVSLSYQYQKRETEEYRYNITNDVELNSIKRKDQSMEVFYSIGTFNPSFSNSKMDLQLGYEAIKNKGFAIVDEENNQEKEVSKSIDNIDFFSISEINLSDSFSIRSGLRYSFQSLFKNQYAASLGNRILLPKNYEFRASLGKSYRTPTFTELYNQIIFDGHYFVGNENLVPEKSTSYEISLKKQLDLNNGYLKSNFITNYLLVNDKITSALTGFEGATPIYEYINISKFRSLNFTWSNNYQSKKWNFSLGGSLTGISRQIDNLEFSSDDTFLYNFNLNSNVSYTFLKYKTILSAYYKFTGKTQQYIAATDGYLLSEIEPYSWLDLSVRKLFYNDIFELTLGARNLLDVNNVNQSNLNQSGGHEVSSQILLAYGRSYFLKLTCNLNF
ncbi:TonB-dependent receptor [Flavobacterium sp. 9AF]|uniref:TonB-dependent receptor plug domain-containing protein n=1 Tax=Flavobacterium sp. 9AF TaxID=2653142 RepID=UPI0012F351A9|nr:TonB-dependent receptor [Flavobacterium sp. 9AF]VXB24254.1 TonB-dependent receptor [Flavobacterium sp. 9AF]